MHDSSLMGLNCFPYPKMAWERPCGRGPTVARPRSASSLLVQGSERLSLGKAAGSGPRPSFLPCSSEEHVRWEDYLGNPLPLGISVRCKSIQSPEEIPWFLPAGCGIALVAENEESFPGCWLGQARQRHPMP